MSKQTQLTPNALIVDLFGAFTSVAQEICREVRTRAESRSRKAPNSLPAEVHGPEVTALERKLGKSSFVEWQHLRGIMETADTAIHVHAYNLDVAG